MRVLRGRLLLLLLVSQLANAQGLVTRNHSACIEALQITNRLSAFAWNSDAGRSVDPTGEALWYAFKNGPNPSPARVDLSQPSKMKSADLSQLDRESDFYLGRPTVYEQQVIHLKKGDAIVYDEREFTLGEFLGAGNTTHIFRVASLPGNVIRIPFVAKGLLRADYVGEGSQDDRLKRIFSFVRSYVERMRGKAGAVEIQADLKFRYVISSEVHGKESGLDFIERTLKQTVTTDDPLHWFYWSERTPAFQALSIADTLKIRSLMKLMRANSEARLLEGPGPAYHSFMAAAARQYLWDEALGQWILVDSV
jgi:hypothetical protein